MPDFAAGLLFFIFGCCTGPQVNFRIDKMCQICGSGLNVMVNIANRFLQPPLPKAEVHPNGQYSDHYKRRDITPH